MTLAPVPSVAGADEGISSLMESIFRLPRRGVSCHKAHTVREEGVGLEIDSL